MRRGFFALAGAFLAGVDVFGRFVAAIGFRLAGIERLLIDAAPTAGEREGVVRRAGIENVGGGEPCFACDGDADMDVIEGRHRMRVRSDLDAETERACRDEMAPVE